MLGKNRGKSRLVKRRTPPPSSVQAATEAGDSHCEPRRLSVIPRNMSSGWSLVQFADTVELSTLEDVLNCELTTAT